MYISTPLPHSPAPFKFLNVWADREDFLDIVKSAWESPIRGTPIYSFTAKLRLLKHSLKTLHMHHTSHISSRVVEAKQRWTSAQILLDESPASVIFLLLEGTMPSYTHSYAKRKKPFISRDQEFNGCTWGTKILNSSIGP